MIKSSLVFTPDPTNHVTTCAPNGTGVTILSGPNRANEVQPATGLLLTLPTQNGFGNGVLLPGLAQNYTNPGYVPQDLLIVNASDFQIYVAFGAPMGSNLSLVPTGPTPPVGPQVAGCLIVPAQSDVLLTVSTVLAAYASANSQVVTGAMALAASIAEYASIFSNGNSGLVSFMRGNSNVQFNF